MRYVARSSQDVIETLANERFVRDFAGPGQVLHRRIGPTHVYMVYGAPQGSLCSFQAGGRPELWDPWTGNRRALSVVSQTGGVTALRMPLTEKEAQLIVFGPGPAEVDPAQGGAALPEPIALTCAAGQTELGDWSRQGVLETYSGGAWYRKTVNLTPEQIRGRVVLSLGEVACSAEVHINGRPAGVRVSPPWSWDVTEGLMPGHNRMEVLVYNTLANHYVTIPTRYRGVLTSGLLGPARIKIHHDLWERRLP
jgi:hypothetical protein